MDQDIVHKIVAGKNILLIGKTNSGKSFFVKNELIPLLEKNNLRVSYFEDCDAVDLNTPGDVFIVDEVELLFDKELLEEMHPEEKPYYTAAYLEKVASWQKKLSKITKPVICIVTRNDEEAIQNVYKNYSSLEWNTVPVEVLIYNR